MAIETICGCGERLRVADEHAGKTARCPKCRALYTVPTPQPSVAEAYAPPAMVPAEAWGQVHPLYLTPGSPDDLYYVKTATSSFGPITRKELQQWQAEGRLLPGAMVQREGLPWITAELLFRDLTSAPVPPAPGANPYADAANPGYPAPPNFALPHRGVLVLILGFAALGSMCACAPLGALASPVVAIGALAVGVQELRRMHAGHSNPAGKGLVIAGMVLSAVPLLLMLGYLAIIVVGNL